MKKNGKVPSSIWITEIGQLSDEQIRKGISKVRENIRSGNAWAPDLADFLALIHGQSEVDYHAAFMRCLAKAPEGRVEQWVYENAGYNIRVSSHESAERMHKKFMKEALMKERRGELRLNSEMLKALPPNSVKNTNDLARERYTSQHGNKLHPRIAKILKRDEG